MDLLLLFLQNVPIVALCSYIILLLFFWFSQKDRLIKSFMLFLAGLILWTASAVFMSVDLYPGVLFWDRIMVVGMIIVSLFLYLFASIFTDSVNRIWLLIWGMVAIAANIVNAMGLVVTDAEVITNTVTVFGRQFTAVSYDYTLGPMVIPVYISIFMMIIGILLKVRRSLRNGDSNYKRFRLVAIGSIVMTAGVLLNFIPALGQYPVDLFACFVNAILIVIAIFKYRFMDVRFMITKGLVYSLFTILITVAYIFSVFFIQNHVGSYYGKITPYITTLIALAVAIIFQPLFRIASRLVNKLFYKAEYSRRKALRKFSQSISNNLDLNSIAQELIDSIQLALNAVQVLVLLKNEEKKVYNVFRTSSLIYQPDLQISFDNPIIRWLQMNDTGLSREELYSQPFFKSMWEKEKFGIYNLGIEVIIPIKIREDIIAMLMLTRKNNNTAYTLDDMDLLTYLGASTAVAFENARLYNRSQMEAITDSLTGLYNHRYFFKMLFEKMEEVGSGELSLLLLDLDFFKLYNDLYGHFEGDQALVMVASILRRVVGDKGIVCRYGGEEFTILLPYHDSRQAFEVSERIRLEIEASFFNSDDVTQRFLTSSIGICTYPHAAPNAEELLKRADLAMYKAKNLGKNQSIIYSPMVASLANANKTEDMLHKPSYTATIYALTAAIDAKDHYTFGHSQRVAEYSTLLASELNIDKAHIEILREAALLHDIGKLGIPENILTKAGKLNNDEFDIVKKHVEMSITIIKHLPSINHVIPAVIGHHERWDGTGYPRGLKGESIPFAARCLAITDAFDAMTSSRPYRAGFSVNAALNEIKNNIGTQFDPAMANLFIKLVLDGTIKVDKSMDVKNIS